jgi:hypothetical protein
MAVDDLSSIPGLEEKHRKVLAERVGVTTCDELARADPTEIFDAMRRLRPRPTVDEIVVWQDAAIREVAARADGSEWDRAATFVVSFEQRNSDTGWERQLVVEQTELEPEQPPKVWPNWDCGDICSWMSTRLEVAESSAQSTLGKGATGETPSVLPAPMQIEIVELRSGGGEVNLMPKRSTTAPGAVEFSSTGHAVVAVTGVDPDQVVHVVARERRPGRPGLNLHKPVVRRGGGTVELPLSRLAVGDHEAKVVAWAPDQSVAASALRLPRLIRRPQPEEPPDAEPLSRN